jgi:hypothetical protein
LFSKNWGCKLHRRFGERLYARLKAAPTLWAILKKYRGFGTLSLIHRLNIALPLSLDHRIVTALSSDKALLKSG